MKEKNDIVSKGKKKRGEYILIYIVTQKKRNRHSSGNYVRFVFRLKYIRITHRFHKFVPNS